MLIYLLRIRKSKKRNEIENAETLSVFVVGFHYRTNDVEW